MRSWKGYLIPERPKKTSDASPQLQNSVSKYWSLRKIPPSASDCILRQTRSKSGPATCRATFTFTWPGNPYLNPNPGFSLIFLQLSISDTPDLGLIGPGTHVLKNNRHSDHLRTVIALDSPQGPPGPLPYPLAIGQYQVPRGPISLGSKMLYQSP